MKIIGWKKKGNLVRFALGEDDLEYWHGDDFDDRPYEHNADTFPYSEYISDYEDVIFYWDIDVMEAADDWHYEGNSPYSMEDFINKKAPILILYRRSGDADWGNDYSYLLGAENSDKYHKIYMGENFDTIEKLYSFCELVRK